MNTLKIILTNLLTEICAINRAMVPVARTNVFLEPCYKIKSKPADLSFELENFDTSSILPPQERDCRPLVSSFTIASNPVEDYRLRNMRIARNC
jgi:hypothetical protein